MEVLQPYKDGEEDKRSSTYSAQTDYKLGPKTYLYGSFKGVDSRYSAYFKDYTLSGGLGYQFAYTENFTLEAEIGPGFRYQEPNLDEIDDDDIVFPDIVQEGILRGNINTTWHALDNLSLSADITLVSGRSNTRVDSDLSVTNDITEDIALKLAHSRQYHDKVPEGLSKADSVFPSTFCLPSNSRFSSYSDIKKAPPRRCFLLFRLVLNYSAATTCRLIVAKTSE